MTIVHMNSKLKNTCVYIFTMHFISRYCTKWFLYGQWTKFIEKVEAWVCLFCEDCEYWKMGNSHW